MLFIMHHGVCRCVCDRPARQKYNGFAADFLILFKRRWEINRTSKTWKDIILVYAWDAAVGRACVQISSTVNLVFTAINLAVIVCIVGIGIFYADVNNWTQSPGGFFPFGFTGVSRISLLRLKHPV